MLVRGGVVFCNRPRFFRLADDFFANTRTTESVLCFSVGNMYSDADKGDADDAPDDAPDDGDGDGDTADANPNDTADKTDE